MEALGALGLALLVTNVALHVALVVEIARGNAGRGALALPFPPLAFVWGFQAGARRRAIGWAATVLGFALVVVVIRFLR